MNSATTLNELLDNVQEIIKKVHGSPVADLPLRGQSGETVGVSIHIARTIIGDTTVELRTHHVD